MIGTRKPATSPMRLMPPMMTRATNRTRTPPNNSAPTWPDAIGNTLANCAKLWFDWNMLPPPKLPPMHITAKTTESTRPRPPRPSSASPSRR